MVSLLRQAANLISGQSETRAASDNRIDRVDQCKIVWYQWANEIGGSASQGLDFPIPLPSGDLSASRSYDISNHIETFSFSKNMANGSGSFSLTLGNSQDWSRIMKPGQWLVAYLTGDGDLPLPRERPPSSDSLLGSLMSGNVAAAGAALASLLPIFPTPELNLPPGPTQEEAFGMRKRRRAICVIQRVGIRSSTSPDGSVELSYVVSGKDFGVVLEETELWFNANNADGQSFQKAIDALSRNFTKNLSELLSKYYDIFLNPKSALSEALSSITTFFPEQYVLPDKLSEELGLSYDSSDNQGYFGNVAGIKEFNATVLETSDPLPFASLQGTAWARMKSVSQPEFHELFTEISDEGTPKLIFRPIPWSLDKSKYPVIGAAMLSYADLAKPDEVIPPLPAGSIISGLNTSQLRANIRQTRRNERRGVSSPDFGERRKHSVYLNSKEVDSFDLGPDYHSRANFFLVESARSAFDQGNSFSVLSRLSGTAFPLRDESDIKRYGFRPKFVQVNTFNLTNAALFGNSPTEAFLLELNSIVQDFYGNAKDYFSGSMSIAAGRNDVKLGKVIVTDDSFKGIADMVFYIEGYTDTFQVNPDGTTSWTQTLTLTRGIEKSVLDGSSPRYRQETPSSTFHVLDQSDGSPGLLGGIANAAGAIGGLLR